MIEVYPKTIDEDKLKTSLNKLVSAFLMVAEDLIDEEDTDNLPLTMPLTLNCKTRKKELERLNSY